MLAIRNNIRSYRLFTNMEKDDATELYMTGGCGIFAIALHKVFGYPIGALLDTENIEYYDENEEPIASVIHVFTHKDNKIIDVKGIRSIEEMKACYWDVEGHVDWKVSEGEIREEYSGDDKPLYPVLASDVQEAIEYIESNRAEYDISSKQTLTEYVKALIQEEYERGHMTKKLFKKFKDIPTEQQQIGAKPKGFWYDCNGEWARWVTASMPYRIGKHNYKVQVDLSKMIVIRNYRDFVAFENKYKTMVLDQVPGFADENDLWINWPKVAQDYSGIEIAPFIRKADDRNWYYVWDVASGCIWEKSAFKGVEKA